MIINQGFLAATLLIRLGLVSAQGATMAECLAAGFTQCWCNCALSADSQYCSAAATLVGCHCTNLNYRTPMLACVQSSNCTSVSQDIVIAEEECSLAGFTLALPPSFALSTSAGGGSVVLNTASASAGSGSTGLTPLATTGASGQGSTASHSGLQPGAIAGIVIGSIAVLVIVIIGIILILQGASRNKAAAVSCRDQC